MSRRHPTIAQIGQRPEAALVQLVESLRGVANRLLRIHEGDVEQVEHARALLEEAPLEDFSFDAPRRS